MKRLIQRRPYYLQHQRKASPPPTTPPLTLTCAPSLSLSFFLFQHSLLSWHSLFFSNSVAPSLYLPLSFAAEVCAPAGRRQEGVRRVSLTIKMEQFVVIMTQTVSLAMSCSCSIVKRLVLINDYLCRDKSIWNCAKPIPISSGFLLEAFTWWVFMLW